MKIKRTIGKLLEDESALISELNMLEDDFKVCHSEAVKAVIINMIRAKELKLERIQKSIQEFREYLDMTLEDAAGVE